MLPKLGGGAEGVTGMRRRVKLLPACCVVGLKKRSQKGLNK